MFWGIHAAISAQPIPPFCHLSIDVGAGGVMSLLALLAMGVLAVQHVSHFARVELETKVEVDEFADQPLRIEFNVCNATHRPNLRHPHLTESTRAHLRS